MKRNHLINLAGLMLATTLTGCITPPHEKYDSSEELFKEEAIAVDAEAMHGHSDAMKILYLATKREIEKADDLDTLADDHAEKVERSKNIGMTVAAAELLRSGPFGILNAALSYNTVTGTGAKMPRYNQNLLVVIEPIDDITKLEDVTQKVHQRIYTAINSMMIDSGIPFVISEKAPLNTWGNYYKDIKTLRVSRMDSEPCLRLGNSTIFDGEYSLAIDSDQVDCAISHMVPSVYYTNLYKGGIHLTQYTDSTKFLVTAVALRPLMPVSMLASQRFENGFLFMPRLSWMDIGHLTSDDKKHQIIDAYKKGDFVLHPKMINLSTGQEMPFGYK